MKNCSILLLILLCFSCKEPQARKPVSIRSGASLSQSIERTKVYLEKEQVQIKNYIKQDSLHTYINSNSGFWYTWINKNSNNVTPAKFGDKITYTYTISDLNNNNIYSYDDIGVKQSYIDQESNIIEGLRQALKLLKPNEEMQFIFPSQLAYGYRGDTHKIAPNTAIICTIETLSITLNNN